MSNEMKENKKKKKMRQPGKKLMIGGTMGFVIIVYGTFVFFPILYGLWTSFYNWNPFQSQFDYVGLENYSYVIKSPEFWTALKNTILFTLGSLLLTVGFSLIIAGVMQAIKKGKGVYRGLYFLPVISSMVATAMLWKFMFSYDDGLFNSILMQMGVGKVPWLQDAKIALPALIIVETWKDIGYALVLVLAGINNIDPSIYESAKIDGASTARQFFSITLPLIRNTMTILIITKLIDYMQVYTPVKFITEGGPGKSTWTMSFYIFEEAFTYYNFGLASAVSFLLFAIIFVFSLIQMRFDKES